MNDDLVQRILETAGTRTAQVLTKHWPHQVPIGALSEDLIALAFFPNDGS